MEIKKHTIIGSWTLVVDGIIYEGDTQERLDEIRNKLLARGETFTLVATFDRVKETNERGFQIWKTTS